MNSREAGVALLVAAWAVGLGAHQDEADETLARVSEYVERYYARTQSVLAEETVTIQPLTSGFSPEGFARRLVYELRVEWDPEAGADGPSATVVRELISAAGPPLGPPDQPDCLDPRAVSPEPLAFLLPGRTDPFMFAMAGTARVAGRDAVRLDYRPVAPASPQVDWDGQCGRFELPGRIGGRVWVDASTSEILRLDRRLVGMVDIPGPERQRRADAPRWFTIERADTSTHYRPIAFEDPDETLMLPVRISSLTIIRNSGVPRVRITRSFANYRRFVTDSRIVH